MTALRGAITFARDFHAAIAEGLCLALDICYPVQGAERAAAAESGEYVDTVSAATYECMACGEKWSGAAEDHDCKLAGIPEDYRLVGEPPLTADELIALRIVLEQEACRTADVVKKYFPDPSSTASAAPDDSPGEVSANADRHAASSPSPGLPTSATEFAGAMYPMHTKR